MDLLPTYFSEEGPGAALAVITDGREPVVECVGLADVERRVSITPETVFELASVSKVFTATAIMLLVQRHQLDLGSPAEAYVSALSSNGAQRSITIRDLLWHTSGLVDYLEAGMYTPVERTTEEYVLGQLSRWGTDAVVGREHRYSNTNYVVLARIVEKVTGLKFTEFVTANLIEPFGLRSTALGSTKRGGPDSAMGYQNLGYGLPHIEPSIELRIETEGDGGVRSSLTDLTRWWTLFWNGEIVEPRSLRLMQTPGELDSGERFAYGLGLQIEGQEDGRHWCGHGGSWTDATVLIGRYLREKTTVIVLSNELMAPVERISQRAFSISQISS